MTMELLLNHMDDEDVEWLAVAEDSTWSCLQVAPVGDGRTALLFLLSDPDYVETISLIWVVDDFRADSGRLVRGAEEWLMSLAADQDGALTALEATTAVLEPPDWSRTKVSENGLKRVWCARDGTIYAVGQKGGAFRRNRDGWSLIEGGDGASFFDVAGNDQSVFACGDNGRVHRLNGPRAQALELNRGDKFRGIDVATDGTIRLAGDGNACVRVIGDEAIELEGAPKVSFTVRCHRDVPYWGTVGGVFVEKGDAMRPFAGIGPTFDLRSDGEFLYSAAASRAWRFDGEEWKALFVGWSDGEFQLQEGP